MPNMGVDEFEYNHKDEAPLSPVDQVFRELYSPKSENVISCALGLRDPIDVDSLKKAISNSIMIKHPRFCSLVVKDQKSGLQHWKRTRVNIEDHIFVHQQTIMKIDVKLEDEKEAAINAFLAKISVATPLSENKPLWEVHVLLGLNCVVFRVHHSLGDGVSLMSMLSACFGKPRPPVLDIQGSQDNKKKKNDNNNAKKKWRRDGILEQVKRVWYTIAFLFKVIGRLLWVKEISVLSGGDGVELWPRIIVTAKFNIHELKSIKSIIPKATINDVLLGIISSGLSKYLNIKSSNAVQKVIHQLNFVIPVNMRKDSFVQILNSELSGWGNKTSVVILPTNCSNGLPLEHVKEKKSAMDKLKLSYWPQLILQFISFTASCFGPKVASWFFRKVVCFTTSTISNIVGPSEELLIADNPVTYIKVNISSIPHAITMLIVSYAGMVNLQVMVAKDIIPDPELIVKCFQDSFQEMRRSLKTNLQG